MTADVPTLASPRPLRRDAAHNRTLILRAAAAVFAERGLEAGYDEIARRAGVGVGTVYRRFPERSELVEALFESRMADVLALAEECAALADAWDGLRLFLQRTVELQVEDRGLKDAMVLGETDHLRAGRARLAPVVDRLVARAQAEGALRTDMAATDLALSLAFLSSLATPDQPDLWRRYLALVLDGMRARPSLEPLPGQAPSEETIGDLMLRDHRR